MLVEFFTSWVGIGIIAMLLLYVVGMIFQKKSGPYYKTNDIDHVTFSKRSLVNYSEKQVYYALLGLLKKHNLDNEYNVFTQVSYGEMFKTDGKRTRETDLAFRAINTKRADFVIADKNFLPTVIVEYHGEGHFKGKNYSTNDNIKLGVAASSDTGYVVLHYKYKKNLMPRIEEIVLPYLL